MSSSRTSLVNTTELLLNHTAVYEEMKQGGPLAPEAEHGVKDVRDTLKRESALSANQRDPLTSCTEATTRADAVFQPILDARTKAERLKSTLGVFERSKFFFNLPTILGEAVEDVSLPTVEPIFVIDPRFTTGQI